MKRWKSFDVKSGEYNGWGRIDLTKSNIYGWSIGILLYTGKNNNADV